jgi:hypothetical protein
MPEDANIISSQLNKMRNKNKKPETKTNEFRLVVRFLTALTFLVALIMWMPADYITGSYETKPEDVIEFKKELLAILLTAFGAWIGAGAAYFFGRENLREAYQGMKSLQRRSPTEILQSTLIKDLPPRGIEYSVKPSDTFKAVKERLWKEQSRWFFIYTNKDGEFIAAIHEEEIWRMRADVSEYVLPAEVLKVLGITGGALVASSADSLDNITMDKILIAIAVYKRTREDKAAAKAELANQKSGEIVKSLNISELFSAETSAFIAEQLLNEQSKHLGIVTDAQNLPTGFFTTGDIRRALTGSSLNTGI